MFLYVASTANLSVSLGDIPRFVPGKIQVVRRGSAAIVWIEDTFTRGVEGRDALIIEVRRPKIDQWPVVQLNWNLCAREVTLERRWSGEFTAYLGRRPTWILASHLRLVAWVCRGLPPGVTTLRPGQCVRISNGHLTERNIEIKHDARKNRLRFDYDKTVAKVRKLVKESVSRTTDSSALLLSGGVDSSVIAAVGKSAGKRFRPFVFGLEQLVRPQLESDDDFLHARKVARHFGLRLNEIRLESLRLIQNVPTAVALSETSRGTIIDDCVALIEVARILAESGYSTVWTGECADDLFGGFKFALRYYKGSSLRKYYWHELRVSLPNELSILQKIFEPWGISVVHPFWTRELKSLAEDLPLPFRVDPKRLMKRVLRDAFSGILPPGISERPKGVTRDTTQIRFVLESRFGTSRERYRPVFRKIFRNGFTWPARETN
jgi:asparagine synthetase B (glutamine-hydrolysing)